MSISKLVVVIIPMVQPEQAQSLEVRNVTIFWAAWVRELLLNCYPSAIHHLSKKKLCFWMTTVVHIYTTLTLFTRQLCQKCLGDKSWKCSSLLRSQALRVVMRMLQRLALHAPATTAEVTNTHRLWHHPSRPCRSGRTKLGQILNGSDIMAVEMPSKKPFTWSFLGWKLSSFQNHSVKNLISSLATPLLSSVWN